MKQGRRADVRWAAIERSEEVLPCTDATFVDETRPVIVCGILAVNWLHVEGPCVRESPLKLLQALYVSVKVSAYRSTMI